MIITMNWISILSLIIIVSWTKQNKKQQLTFSVILIHIKKGKQLKMPMLSQVIEKFSAYVLAKNMFLFQNMTNKINSKSKSISSSVAKMPTFWYQY